MRAGWISDIHLNFLNPKGIRRFLNDILTCGAEAWFLTGDIGEAKSVGRFLSLLEAVLPGKIYFVLGNHDFYGAGISQVRMQIEELTSRSRRLVWLTQADSEQLPGGVAVVGDDGWADARLGSPYVTPVELMDFRAIDDFRGLDRQALVSKMRELGDEAAHRLAPKLDQAAFVNERLFVLTHVPPFWGSARHKGQLSKREWVPWFTCSAIGEVLVTSALAHPAVRFDVFCGHTHSAGRYSPKHNLTIHAAHAEYGIPVLQETIDLAA